MLDFAKRGVEERYQILPEIMKIGFEIRDSSTHSQEQLSQKSQTAHGQSIIREIIRKSCKPRNLSAINSKESKGCPKSVQYTGVETLPSPLRDFHASSCGTRCYSLDIKKTVVVFDHPYASTSSLAVENSQKGAEEWIYTVRERSPIFSDSMDS